MRIYVETSEAADRLEELADLVIRQDEVMICRNGDAIAMLLPVTYIEKNSLHSLLKSIADGRPAANGQTSNHDEMYDDMGLPE